MIGIVALDNHTGYWDSLLIAQAGDRVDDLPNGDDLLERFQLAVDLMLELDCDEIVLNLACR